MHKYKLFTQTNERLGILAASGWRPGTWAFHGSESSPKRTKHDSWRAGCREASIERLSQTGHGDVAKDSAANSKPHPRQDHERPEVGVRVGSRAQEEHSHAIGRLCGREISEPANKFGEVFQREDFERQRSAARTWCRCITGSSQHHQLWSAAATAVCRLLQLA